MTEARRISVRLGAGQTGRLEELCRQTGCDISDVVRQALEAFLTCKSSTGPNNAPYPRLSPPAAIIPLTTSYRAYGNGDARKELKELFMQLLAAGFALKELYPRTKGPREIYEALLPLVGISEWTSV
jgi:ribbon-helix-helix CopG family protein